MALDRYDKRLKGLSSQLKQELSKKYKKVRSLNKLDYEDYRLALKTLMRSSTLALENCTTRNGDPFHFIHLRAISNEEIKFCGELFKPKKNMEALSKQLKYSSVFVSNTLFMNINNILEALNNEMSGYKLVPVRWSHEVNDETKVVFLKIPRGEFLHFANKAQHLKPFDREWFECILKIPRIYFKMGNQTFHLSHDGTTMYDDRSSLPVVLKNKRLFECFKLFMLQTFISTFQKRIHKMSEEELSFWITLSEMKGEEFWYFTDKSSSKWADK